MIPKRMTTIASRWLIFVLLAFRVFAPRAQAQNDAPTAINGVYTGEFTRSGSLNMKLKFSIKSTDDGSLAGLFTFDLPAHAGASVTYKLTGRYVAGAHDYGLQSSPFQFTTVEPMGSLALDAFDASKVKAVHVGITSPGSIAGSLTGSNSGSGLFNCGWLHATRDRTESANLDSVMAAQLRAAGVAGTTAPAAGAAPTARPSSIDGVYNGSYAGNEGPTKFKLTVTQQGDRTLTGVLTLYLSEGSGTNAYTCELTGFYIPARGTQPNRIQLVRRKWETQPPSRLGYMAGMDGVVDPDGGNGAGQISGRMSDSSTSQFQAIRDAAESADLARARLPNNLRPSIEGVFNGTYTREKEPPTKFKLTIMHTGAILAGVATIYLPTDSGTKAYTYSLKGVEVGYGNFDLKVYDWETIPPKDFKDFKGMGFNGTFVPNMTQNTARIISVQASGSLADFFVPKFEATWDATESADIKGAIAAQKAVRDADQAAALKAHAEAMKNAPPKQLASKDLVRKSKAYWDAYETDMIREVFDGGFGGAIDENQLFQELFCTYVETFAKKCRANLPAKHESATITRYSSKPDGNGGYYKVLESSFTVEVDSRFAPKYRQFAEALGSPGQGLRAAVHVAANNRSPRDMMNDLLAPARDMQRFFVNHAGTSAAMRQLTENFLRGATGDPSLQQAGEKIDGAQAETEKDLPPGRFARFVDGANAFYRDRVNENPTRFGHSSSHDSALCQRLAELYQSDMTREEEYYYANDFETRFFGQIMQPRAYCTDPEWPRLHPAVEKCEEELAQ